MNQTPDTGTPGDQDVVLEGDTYEIIRKRLITHGKELKDRLGKLNRARKDIFGSIESTLLATERITTRNNCMPRDMIPINGNTFIFGYNVHMGLKSETKLSDVFAIYEYQDHAFTELPLDLLNSGRFEEDFKSLYKYYKDTKFAKFSIIGPHLFMVFRVGKSVSDIKTFKWIIQGNELSYVDNRSDHEFKFPAQHEFTWIRTKREAQRHGEHPHIAIEDRLFVEAVGGDITFKIEDNTETGQGIYAEPVDNPDQTLDDSEIFYAVVGHMILVKVRPYMEKAYRYFVFNEKIQEVSRVDEIESSCVLLPDDQGLIFSNGYYLQTGELKIFESRLTNMMYENRLASANGEDFLYVFYHQESGDYILLHYNLIEQKVDVPILCNGFSCFGNGELLYSKGEEEPTRHHVIQIFQTPFVSGEHAFTEKSDAFLYKIGNPDIVRCMAECHEVFRLLQREDVYSGLYVDLVKKTGDISDSYFWLDREDAFNLKEVLLLIKAAAEGAIDEFQKVVKLKKRTRSEVARVTDTVREILRGLSPAQMDSIDLFVNALTRLRSVRGEVISLKELRYVDLGMVDGLEEEIKSAVDEMSQACVSFLLTPVALDPYANRVEDIRKKVDKLDRVTEAKALMEETETTAKELEMLIEIVSNLKIEDSTQTTRIIDAISNVYAELNKVKAGLKNKIKTLAGVEGVAQFNAQLKLLNQSVINYLDICDTPEKCDEYLTKMMIQVEELEGKFADFDDFILQLTEKRDELYTAFETRKLSLVEARNKKADTLMRSAERILKGIATRVASFTEINDINGYFAADLMIEKIRDIVKQLVAIDDTVKADDIQSRLKTIREDTVRQLKDRKELYADGDQVIKFGEHKFSVNRQPLDLTIVHRDTEQVFHLTGTNFFETIDSEEFEATRPVWDMEVPSEDKAVYRAEYLAFRMLGAVETGALENAEDIRQILLETEDPDNPRDSELAAHIRQFMGPRYAEGYTKGIHDQDGCAVFRNLAKVHFSIGLLRFHPGVRALARVFWHLYADNKRKSVISAKLSAFGVMRSVFPGREEQQTYVDELTGLITEFVDRTHLFPGQNALQAGHYLFFELTGRGAEGEDHFVISKAAADLADGFLHHLKTNRFMDKFTSARDDIMSVPESEFDLVRDWVGGYAENHGDKDMAVYIDEAAAILFVAGRDPVSQGKLLQKRDQLDVPMIFDIPDMAGDHPVIHDGVYRFNYIGFMEKLNQFEEVVLPGYNRFQELKKELTENMRRDLRLAEFKPRILSSFVRNKLINQVYLPLVGDNLAKQIGVVGEQKRTDLMGLLLLISPPGYGKTTLMEYLANRLGIIFMKINGPAIGHNVTSLDPAEAPNASAREEVKKLNLSLEMGDNVMIYLDDIQHCNPEFLQKFISLCDAQRKIEGVYKGRSRTYDLRGKKVVVVMAGNPYTESGEKFKIPDMLANRADTYNLGDIIGDNADVFKMSYLENALTSNPILNKLSSRSQEDVYGIIRIAETDDREGVAFSGTYSVEEVNEMVSVMKKMIVVRNIILKVNKAYILSAAQADEYRTEPPFKLQGSYRNMNRIAEKIVPIMNDSELTTLILSHYENEAQTLTTGTEANLLKFRELTNWLNPDEENRWQEIKKGFKKIQLFHGADAQDPVNRVVAQLSAFQDGLGTIGDVLNTGIRQITETGKEKSPEISISEKTMAMMKELVADAKTAIAASQDNKTDKKTGDAPLLPPKVEVVSKLPKAVLDIIQRQFDMMHTWMAPAVNEIYRQSEEFDKIEDAINQLKVAYKGVIREKGDFDEAIVYYNKAIEVDPKDAESYYNRGLAWYNKKDLRKALSDVSNALTLDPKNRKYQRFVSFLETEVVQKAPDK